MHSSVGSKYLLLKIPVEHGNKDQLELYSYRYALSELLWKSIYCLEP